MTTVHHLDRLQRLEGQLLEQPSEGTLIATIGRRVPSASQFSDPRYYGQAAIRRMLTGEMITRTAPEYLVSHDGAHSRTTTTERGRITKSRHYDRLGAYVALSRS